MKDGEKWEKDNHHWPGQHHGRVSFKKAATQLGLSAANDPDPEQGLFDRSDNVYIAAKGIPAPAFSLGLMPIPAMYSSTITKLPTAPIPSVMITFTSSFGRIYWPVATLPKTQLL